MAKNLELNVRLTRGEIGQILDGLEVRATAWERTAEYLRTGEMSADDLFIVEECRDAEEARAVAADYRDILRKIRGQLPATDGTRS